MIAMLGATSNEASSGDLFFRFPFKVFHEESMHMTNFHAEFKSDIFEIKVEKFSALWKSTTDIGPSFPFLYQLAFYSWW